jgi:hypothetical protein
MLSPEALRLVTVEILRPTASLSSGVFPTVAGAMVFDSREVPVQDLDPDRKFTPVISVYSGDASLKLRGELTDMEDVEHQAVLDIVVELAIISSDPQGQFADAMAANDPQARLVLAALCSQIRFMLERSEAGYPWRKLAKRVISLEELPFAVPDIGLRFQRMTMRYTVELSADVYQVEDGGLPEPLRSVYAALPEGSYARAKLTELAGYFAAETPDQLQSLMITASAGSLEINAGVDLTTP